MSVVPNLRPHNSCFTSREGLQIRKGSDITVSKIYLQLFHKVLNKLLKFFLVFGVIPNASELLEYIEEICFLVIEECRPYINNGIEFIISSKELKSNVE